LNLAEVSDAYTAYGDGVQVFDWISGAIPASKVPKEAMLEGVAGCGKTRLLAEAVKVICRTYPESRGLVLRETRKSLNTSFCKIWEDDVWGPDHPIIRDGPKAAYRDHYIHPLLGGEVWLGGMDEPRKFYSSEWDWIYFVEAMETQEEKWMSLHRGTLDRIVGQFTDNPVLFDH
jgi:hypothetical protein